MTGMWSEIERFAGDEGGATAVEYGLVAALVATAAIVAIIMTGDGLANLFGGVEERATTVFDEADV
jgi:pilus assembly protein Flp/PilA